MKKTTSLLLLVAILFMTLFSFAGCSEEEMSPVELFKLGSENLEEFFSFGTNMDTDFLAESNKVDISLENMAFSTIDTDEPIAVPNLYFSGITSGEDTVMNLAVGSSDNSLAELLLNANNSFGLMFPAVTDYYITGTVDDVLTILGDDAAAFEKYIGAVEGLSGGSYMADFEEYENRFMTEEYIKSEKIDMTVAGTDYKGLTEVTLSIPESEMKGLMSELIDMMGATEDVNHDEISASSDISLFFADKDELIRFEWTLVCEGITVELYGDLTKDGNTSEADMNVTVRNGEAVMAQIPVTYSCKIEDGKIDGSLSAKFDISGLRDYFENTAESAEDTLSEEGVAASTSTLFDMVNGMSFTEEWSGTVSDTAIALDMKTAIGLQGITFTVPYSIALEQTENTLSARFSIDTGIMGLKLKADAMMTLEKEAVATRIPLEGDGAISLSALINDDEAEWQKLAEAGNDFNSFLESNAELFEFIDYLLYGEDDYGDSEVLFTAATADSMDVVLSFYKDGTGYLSAELDAVPTGDKYGYVLSYNGVEIAKVELDEDDEYVMIDGDIFIAGESDETEVYFESLENDTYVSINAEGDKASVYCSFYYEMDDEYIDIEFYNLRTERIAYSIDEEESVAVFDGVEMYYYPENLIRE